MLHRLRYLLICLAAVAAWGHHADAALLGLPSGAATPQPYVTAEELTGSYHYTGGSTKKGLFQLDGNGSTGGSITYTEGGATHLFTGYGRWHLDLTVNDAGTVFSGHLTVRGNRSGGSALDSGDGKTDEILFSSSAMKRFGFSVNQQNDLFEFVFTQQAVNAGAYGPIGGSIGVVVPLGIISQFTGSGSKPFNISDFSVIHGRTTAFYPEPSGILLMAACGGSLLARRRRRRT